MTGTGNFDIKDPTLAESGCKRIEWAWQEMPVLRELDARLGQEQPLRGIRLSGCLHITTKTANNIRIDTLTAEQLRYLSSWQEGT